MKHLEKEISQFYKEYYIGKTKDKLVTCVLDDNDVHFTVVTRSKPKRSRYYSNEKKEQCLAGATKILNS